MKKLIYLIVFYLLSNSCKKEATYAGDNEDCVKDTSQKQSVVFIAGFDEGENTYYSNAKTYFKEKNAKLVDSLFSLAAITTWLNQHHNYKVYDEIHVVSHSNEWMGMSLKTTTNGERISLSTLQDAMDSIPKVINGITAETKLIFHSCGLGKNKALLKELKSVFLSEEAPMVYASTFFNVFGGKYAGHYLAKPYYGFYPTAESPGLQHLAGEFKAKHLDYDIDWLKTLKLREEQSFGTAYSYRFNIPVEWEFTFDEIGDIPDLKNRDEIMDWIVENEAISEKLFQLGIPIEKYRWRTSTKDKTMRIKGKSTALCVLQPLMEKNDSTEYRNIALDDKELFVML